MSWKEKIKQEFKIITGDGKEYTPSLHQNNSGSIELFAGSFEFSGVDGSFVKRKSSSGKVLSLTFTFQGDEHLDLSENFRISSINKDAWTIYHWKYGTITAQPISISWEDNSINSTLFNVDIKETISKEYPAIETTSKNNIELNVDRCNVVALEPIRLVSVPDQSKIEITNKLNAINAIYGKSISNVDDSSKLENLYKKALSSVNNINDKFIDIQLMINSVVDLDLPIANKIRIGLSAIEILKSNIKNLADKTFFTSIISGLLAKLCLSSISTTDSNNYDNRKDAVNTIENLNDATDEFIELVDEYSADLNDATDEFIELVDKYSAEPEIIDNVISIIDETTANFEDIIYNSLVERVYTVDRYTNIILLAHRLCGSFEYVEEIIKANGINRNELLQITKGKKIIYYSYDNNTNR